MENPAFATGIHNTSEIGRLRKVMLHRPGKELENLMPEYLERLLFDDIPYLKVAQEEHDAFADCLKGRVNDRGGIFRAGTGSAMYYIWHAREIPATPDGRRAGENLAANYSPGLFSRCAGPVSILRSFAKPHLQRVINGGPLTLELHDTVFRTAEAVRKVATYSAV